MKKTHLLICILLTFSLLPVSTFGQTVLLYEGFEGGVKPSGWGEEYVKGTVAWLFQKGGYLNTWPDSAAVGNYNAAFIWASNDNQATRLITPKINLAGRVKPALTFYHIQKEYSGYKKTDQLRVYYKIGADTANPWIMLKEYTTAVEDWTLRTIQIPDEALTDSFYVAFEGLTKYGNGTCIDEVKVAETASTQRRLQSLQVKQGPTTFVASDTRDNPIIRIDFVVSGNSGNVPLQRIKVNSLNTSDVTDLDPGGVKLFFTPDTFFNTNSPIGTAQSMTAGQATFNNINYNLPFGLSSVWITYDIDSAAQEGNVLDASISANEIKVNDTLYPAGAVSPQGFRLIFNKLYFNGFENSPEWSLTGDFEQTVPQGLGGYLNNSFTGGNPDPSSAYGGSKILGNDLTGLGESPGNYEKSVSEDSTNFAVTPSFDFLYYKNVTLNFQRWLNVYISDLAAIDASTDNGANWIRVWSNFDEGGFITEGDWTNIIHNQASSFVDRRSNVSFRFRLGPTSGYRSYCGWNLDNFLIVGDYIKRDVGVSQWITPQDGCGLTAPQQVKVVVKNFGATAVTDPIPVNYSFNGGTTVVTEMINNDIAPGDSIIYAFSTLADLSQPNVYTNVMAYTSLTDDEESKNDKVTRTFYSLPRSTLPYLDNFEQAHSFWRTYGNSNSTFEHGTPNFIKLKGAASGVKAWKTFLTGYYNDDESSFVESPCFNFAGVQKPIFECKIWKYTEDGFDGAILEYSIDDGTTWNLVPKHPYPFDWNWYSRDTIVALGVPGWDSISNGWITAKQFLPAAVENQSQVKFRFNFRSNESNTEEGFGFDDVKIYESPIDVGVSSFTGLTNACQGTNSNYISLYIKNYGYRSLKTGDTIIVGLDVNTNPALKDTFKLTSNVAVGDSVLHTFTKATNLTAIGTYTVKGYTLVEPTPRFYGTRNDTTIKVIQVKSNPIVTLKDTVRSARLDTLKLTTVLTAGYAYYWPYDGTTSNQFQVPAPGKFKVRVTDTGGNNCISWDSSFVVKLIPNVGVDSLLYPYSTCELGSAVHVSLRIKNFGTDTIEKNDTIYASYRYRNGAPVTDMFKLSQRLFPGTTVSHAFASPAHNMDSVKSYAFKTWAKYRWDVTHGDDTLNRNITVYGYPAVNIGPDTTLAGLVYNMDAGPGYKTYLWNTGVTTRTYEARFMGYHWVRVTDIHDCPASDTAFVHLIIHDVGITDITSPNTACSISSPGPVKANITNVGTDTLSSGIDIAVGYSINGGAYVTDSHLLTAPLTPGSSIPFSFAPNENITAVGSYLIRCYAKLPLDIQPSNDTLDETINIWGYPQVNLGTDTTVKALQHVLNAGAGTNYGYLWKDASENQTYIATVPGRQLYWVTVTDTLHGCMERDTIDLTLVIDDVGISGMLSDTAYCHSSFTGFNVRVHNYGSYTLNIGKKIPVYYRMNSATPVADTLTLGTPLGTGGDVTYFVHKVPLLQSGNNVMKVYTNITGDLRPVNDTVSFTLVIYANPHVDLGGINDTIKYITTPVILDAGSGFASYEWNDGATTQIYNATTPGWYWVTVTNSDECLDMDSVYLEFGTAVRNFNSNDGILKIFPNPASEKITVQLETASVMDMTIELRDIRGAILLNSTIKGNNRYLKELDLTPFASGIYYLRLYNKDVFHVEKIIIQK